jgi:hypothetical protein
MNHLQKDKECSIIRVDNNKFNSHICKEYSDFFSNNQSKNVKQTKCCRYGGQMSKTPKEKIKKKPIFSSWRSQKILDFEFCKA